MVTRLKFISGFSQVLSTCFLIFVCVLIMSGTKVSAQTEIFDQNSVGGGPVFGYSSGDLGNAYQIGMTAAKTPDVNLSLTFTKYHVRGSSYMSIAPSFTMFPVKIYAKDARLMLAFHGEYENSLTKVRRGYQQESTIKSYSLGITLLAGGHSENLSSVFLPYITFGYTNILNITEQDHNVFGYGLIFGSKSGESDTFIVVSLGASHYAGYTTYGARLGYFLEKDYIPNNQLK